MKMTSRRLACPAIASLLASLTVSSGASAATLTVGTGKTYASPCAAIAAAQAGDVIEVDAGSYDGDTCAWSTDNLTVRGVGGRARIDMTGKAPAQGKGTFVIYAANATVENFELSGASVQDQNGAGIRHQGLNLTVRNCYFHDNENGILGGPLANGQPADGQGEVLVERSEFADNGYGDGYSHNMYLNHYKKFTLQFSYTHGTKEGHLIKSRALETRVLHNRITDEPGTTASYEIDMPNGGKGFVIGNLIEQGPDTHNPSIITFGEEGPVAGSALYVVNNTVVNDRPAGGTFVNVAGGVSTPAVLRNNVFFGPGTVCNQASAVLDHNLTMTDPKVMDMASFDYHLTTGSPCVDMGADPGSYDGESLAPQYHYVHPLAFEVRSSVGTIDIGAYELGGGSASSSSSSGSTSSSSSSGSTSSSTSSGMASSSGGVGGAGGGGGAGGTGGDGAGDEGGCGCRVAGEGRPGGALGALALAGLLALRRRRTPRR